MLQSIQNDVFNSVLIGYLDIESRVNLSLVLPRFHTCINRLTEDAAFGKRILKCRLNRTTKILQTALDDVEDSVGYKRCCMLFRLLKQIGSSEHILLCRYAPGFRDMVFKKCREFADVSSYKTFANESYFPKKWGQLLRRMSRKILVALRDNPLIYDIDAFTCV